MKAKTVITTIAIISPLPSSPPGLSLMYGVGALVGAATAVDAAVDVGNEDAKDVANEVGNEVGLGENVDEVVSMTGGKLSSSSGPTLPARNLCQPSTTINGGTIWHLQS